MCPGVFRIYLLLQSLDLGGERLVIGSDLAHAGLGIVKGSLGLVDRALTLLDLVGICARLRKGGDRARRGQKQRHATSKHALPHIFQ